MRLGYNVLLLDTDVTIFDDPYKYFKQPPFSDIVVINQEEGGTAANGGILYVQVMFLNFYELDLTIGSTSMHCVASCHDLGNCIFLQIVCSCQPDGDTYPVVTCFLPEYKFVHA